MGKFKDFLISRKLNESLDVNEEDFSLMEEAENELMTQEEDDMVFVEMHHTDNIEEEEQFINEMIEKNEWDFDNMILEEDDENKEEKQKKEEKTWLVNHGVIRATGKHGNSVKVVTGDAKKVSGQEKLDLLQNGWTVPFKMRKTMKDKNGNDYVERIGIDGKDIQKFLDDGWEPQWGDDIRLFDTEKQQKLGSPVFKDKLQGILDKNKNIKIYEPVTVSKLIPKKGKDGQKQQFYSDIRYIDSSQLLKYTTPEDEGGLGYTQGVLHDEDYFNSFAIQVDGGKVHTANFSLTPGSGRGCPNGIPCDKLCYAKAQYEQYPPCHEAWDKNEKLLKEHLDWLERDMDNFFKIHPRMNLFRWHVAGDILSSEHLKIIDNIASKHKTVKFWLYTKNLEALEKFGNSHASNLVIIVSAWNGWELERIEKLHEHYPVAYFDDFHHKDQIPNDDDAYVCPCANYIMLADEKGYKCKTCQTQGKKYNTDGESHPCYMLQKGESVIFRQH